MINREGHRDFDIDQHKGRTPGLSALVRLRDEETWCGLALESFVDWCDEIVITLNCCTDRTPEIIERFRAVHPDKVRVYDYPFEIWPMGPGHDECPNDSVHASAYYYNFTQAKSTRSHVVKLDGDMVMMGWAGAEIRCLMAAGHSRIKFEGRDIVGDDLTMIGCHPKCPTNGVYKVREGVRYVQGPMTQSLRGVPEPPCLIERPAFVHMKFARKSFAAATVQWPEDWREIPHFTRIAMRRHPVTRYTGEYPSSVARLIDG